MVARTLIAGCLLLAAGCLGRGFAQAPAAKAADTALGKRIAAVLPTGEEDRWLEIPWRTNIGEAIGEAQRAGKPVLLWVMNGNPLGCA
jgi:hypothetical protein